jgi:CheY-like chemotaxis protein
MHEPGRRRTWHIVVADDDEDWRALIVMAVASTGLRTTVVADGVALLAECQRLVAATDRSVLVLSDLEMPGMSGLDAMTDMPSLGSRVHVVLITGVTARDMLADAAASGAAAVLHKPVSRRALLDAVAELTS